MTTSRNFRMPVARHAAPAKRSSSRRRDWQDESAGDVAVRLARRHLAAATDAVEHLAGNTDPESLHDFRVALRRLRSALRAYKPCFRTLPKKLRRELKRVTRATSAGRDVEVFLDWLNSRSSHAASEPAAREWLQRRYEQLRNAAYKHLRSETSEDFTVLARRLRQTLAANRSAASYGDVTAARLRDQVARLAAELARVRAVADAESIHAARIQAKRLRYLIEPLEQHLAGARTAIRRLRAFQDETGALCDGFVRRRLLTEAAGAAGVELVRATHAETSGNRPETSVMNDVMSGLLELVRRNEWQVSHQFQRLQTRCLGARTQSWLKPFMRLEQWLIPTREIDQAAGRPAASATSAPRRAASR